VSNQAATYDFTAGISSTNGWQPYVPLAAYGTAYSFSDSPAGYEIQSAPCVNPTLLGPARVGTFLPGSFGDFDLSFDIPSYSASLNEFFGAAARIQTIGLLTSSGYAFGYDNSIGKLILYKVVNEQFQPFPSPTNPPVAPRLQVESVGSGSFGISWSSTPGQVYRAEYNSTLGSNDWVTISPDQAGTGGKLAILVQPSTEPRRFYRVLTFRVGPSQAVALTPGQGYRFTFQGIGASFGGAVYSLNNLMTPLAVVGCTDSTYSSGEAGLLVASRTAAGPADQTFSRFTIIPEPSPALLMTLGALTIWGVTAKRRSRA
jgi:hypothetical protein